MYVDHFPGRSKSAIKNKYYTLFEPMPLSGKGALRYPCGLPIFNTVLYNDLTLQPEPDYTDQAYILAVGFEIYKSPVRSYESEAQYCNSYFAALASKVSDEIGR